MLRSLACFYNASAEDSRQLIHWSSSTTDFDVLAAVGNNPCAYTRACIGTQPSILARLDTLTDHLCPPPLSTITATQTVFIPHKVAGTEDIADMIRSAWSL